MFTGRPRRRKPEALRLLRRAVFGLAGLIAAYLGAGTLGGMIPGPVTQIAPRGGELVEIVLLPGPIHTDIMLPATPHVRAALGFAEGFGVPVNHPGTAWVLVGWGAEDFYTTTGRYSDATLRATWRAATGDRAVLRIEVLGPVVPGPDYTRILLDPAQLDALLAEVTGSLDPDRTDQSWSGFSETDAFLAATGRFHLLNTCNSWVGRTLRRSGVPAGAWTPFTWSLP